MFKQAAIILLAKFSVRNSTMAGPWTHIKMEQDLKTKHLYTHDGEKKSQVWEYALKITTITFVLRFKKLSKSQWRQCRYS